MLRPIIYFGSSFNPPTKAHLALVEYMMNAVKDMEPLPLIVLAPVYAHVFNKCDLADFEPRLALTQLQFLDAIEQGNARVSDIEARVCKTLGQDSSCGTIDILEYIQSHPGEFPDCNIHDISLMLGGDTYNDLMQNKWKNSEKIFQLCKHIHVLERDDMPLLPCENPMVVFHENAISDPQIKSISSSKIRHNLEANQAALVPAVLSEIRSKYPDMFTSV